MKNILVLLLAGEGLRLYSAIKVKKQFYQINGTEMFVFPLKQAIQSQVFSKIILVTNSEDIPLVKQMLFKNGLPSFDIIAGGNSRNESVQKALMVLKSEADDFRIFIHDADRVLITSDFFISLEKECQDAEALTPVIPLQDSILKKTDSGINYLDRKDLFLVQTPQVFDYRKLLEIYENGYDQNDTDDFKKAVVQGLKCKTVIGDALNFKVTSMSDLKILKAIMGDK